MEFVTSIGWLTILAAAFFLIHYLESRKTDQEAENRRLIEHNDRCQELIRNYNAGVISGIPIMTGLELKKKLVQILNEPGEREKALDRISKIEQDHADRNIQKREIRKLAYKYQQEIFEIFEEQHQQKPDLILTAISEKFRLDEEQAANLLNLWTSNSFLVSSYSVKDALEIGPILSSESFKLDASYLTFDEWLNQRKVKTG